MSYQVLARKWRPRFFREMVGQEHVLQALINALDHNRLHHAYLFTGTRGVGKTTIARILAKCLNCETGISSEPCGQCSACQEINDGCFVDLIEVDAASNTGVDDVREIIDNAQYRPTKGRYKVYLIDEVHMLSKNAFNALLKTLEEPPEHVKFLLATTDPQKLPATILSRCLQFYLKNMAPERIVDHLSKVLQQELVEFEEAALWALARSAEGSMRDALSLTDQAIAFGSGKIVEAEVRAMLGSIDQQTVYHLAEALLAHDAGRLLAVIETFSEQAPDYPGVLDELLLLLHRMTIAQIVPSAIDNSLGDQQQVLDLAKSVTAEELQLFYQMGLLGKRDISLAPDLRTGLEMTVLRMLAFRPQGLVEPPSKVLPTKVTDVTISQPINPQQGTQQPVYEPVQAENQFTQSQSQQEAEDSLKKPEPAVTAVELTSREFNHAVEDERCLLEPESDPELMPEPESLDDPDLSVEEPPLEAISTAADGAEVSDVQKDEPSAALDIKLFTDNDQWVKNFEKLPFTGLLKAVVSACVLLKVDGNHWKFSLDKERAQLYNEQHNQQIADILSGYFSTTVEITILEQASELQTPADYLKQKKQAAYDSALHELQNDSGLQSLIGDYAAEIDLNSVTGINGPEALNSGER